MTNLWAKMLPRLAIATVIAAYIALSIASSFATRLRYGPDEPAHFVYVREIGSHFRMPALSHEITPDISTRSSHEAHQPPLYYALAAVPYFAAKSLGAGTDATWRVLRLFTVLLGAGWVYVLYRLAREFLGGRRCAAALAAACVGLLPSATYIGGVVNNDALGALVFTAALWLIFKCVRRAEIRRKAAVEIGVVCGLAALTKAQGLFLPPILAVAALLIARRNGWKASAPTLANAAIAIVITILISSVWSVRNWLVFGSPMIQSLYNLGPGWSLPAVLLVTEQLFKYFWTPYWLIAVFVNGMLYTRMLVALCFVVFVGVAVHLRINWDAREVGLDRRLDAWALLALPALLIYISLVRHTLLVDKGALQQGRLLLRPLGCSGSLWLLALGHSSGGPRSGSLAAYYWRWASFSPTSPLCEPLRHSIAYIELPARELPCG